MTYYQMSRLFPPVHKQTSRRYSISGKGRYIDKLQEATDNILPSDDWFVGNTLVY